MEIKAVMTDVITAFQRYLLVGSRRYLQLQLLIQKLPLSFDWVFETQLLSSGDFVLTKVH